MKQDHLAQQVNILADARRVRDEVLDSFGLTVKAQLTDQRINPTANYIMEHRNWLRKPDFQNLKRSSNLKQLNMSFMEYFGESLVLPCHLIHISFPQCTIICLEALKMIFENEHNAYSIHQNYTVAKTSSPDEKLKSALHLFHYLISE